jgi:hypothetical protein
MCCTSEGTIHCLNPWDPQSKRQYRIDGCYCTLNAGHSMGGQAHGVCYALEGNGSRESHKGPGYTESNTMYTLNTIEHHAVCYAVDSLSSNSMKSENPHSGFHQTEAIKCLDTR